MSAPDATKRRAVVLDVASLKRSGWRIVRGTFASCMRYRVTGLAAEAAFFAVLSLPPLMFALAGSIGFVVAHFSHTQVTDLRQNVLDAAARALTPQTVDTVIRPTLDEVLKGG
ncbi:MAG TPA: YihY/virulence factor BrkB family protein, partial [Marmoricola sp.]|nr:YihY/virulence factor BrkB family protein [Marmoricola sp.]